MIIRCQHFSEKTYFSMQENEDARLTAGLSWGQHVLVQAFILTLWAQVLGIL